MPLTRRPATSSDTDLARAIHHAAYRPVVERQFGPWDDALQDRLFALDWEPEAGFEILLYDGRPCGYTCIVDRPDDLHVREIVVAPEFQGRGIGAALLREAVAR